MTNKQKFQMAIELVKANTLATAEDVQATVEFLEAQIASINKKSENKKPTKAQAENELIKNQLLQVLDVEGMTITDIQILGFEYSNQKLSALLNQMVKDDLLTKSVGKDRKTLFHLNQDEEIAVQTIEITLPDELEG